MNGLKHVIFALLLMAGGEAAMAAQEFNRDDIRQWMQDQGLGQLSTLEKDQREQALPMIIRAAEFRLHAGSGLPKAIRELGADPEVFAHLSRSKPQSQYPQIWPYMMAGSMILIGNALSEEPVSGYYNVYLDAMMLIAWRHDGKTYMPSRVMAMTGETFLKRTNDTTPLAAWVTRNPSARGLMQRYTEVRNDFAARFPLTSAEPPDLRFDMNADMQRELVEVRSLTSYVLFRGLLHKKDPTGLRKLSDTLRQALAAGDTTTLARLLPADNVMPPEQMVEIPRQTRAAMRPVFFLVTKNYTLMFHQANLMPRFITSTVVAHVEGGIKVASFAFLDLESGYVAGQ